MRGDGRVVATPANLVGFLLGPVAVAAPYVIAWLAPTRASAAALTLGSSVFFLLVRLWAFNELPRSSRAREIDWWFFNLSLYLPVILFTARGEVRIGVIVYPIALATYLVAVSGYLTWQLLLWWAGAAIDGSKLVYMLSMVPLHLAAFTLPMVAGLGVGPQLFAAGVVGLVMQHYYPDSDGRPRDRDAKPRVKV